MSRRIDKDILSLAIPSIISNITTPLLGMVDLAIVGHFGNPVYIGAIALGGSLFSMIYWVFAFLRMGTSGMTAQAVGADDLRERDTSLFRASLVAIAAGTAMIVLQSPILRLTLAFMDADANLSEAASVYFRILIYGAPASMMLYVFNGWFIGLQNSRLTMWLSLIINIVNIISSLVLVYALGMGIEGVATGTLIAQWTGVVAGIAFCIPYKPRLRKFSDLLERSRMRRFFYVNRDIFLRTLCLVAVTIWFTKAGAHQGEIILSANALLMQFFILFSYLTDGYAFAAEALVGKFTGAGDKTMKRVAINALFRHGLLFSSIFTIVYFLGFDLLLNLLSDQREVIMTAGNYKWWAVSIPFAGIGAFIWDGVFIGETRTRGMLISMAISMVIFFAVYFSLYGIMGNHALWLSFIMYLFTRGVIQWIISIRHAFISPG